MITDALLSFVPLGGPLSLVGGSGVAIPSTNIIDLLGAGVGVAPPAIIGNVALFGAPDAMGVGGARPELQISIGTAATTGSSATLTIALQGAPDTASTYQPGTWQTIVQSPALTAAQLTANQVVFRCPWLPPFPANLRPRYLRLLFSPASATSFTAGTIASALVTPCRDDYFAAQAANNYVVA